MDQSFVRVWWWGEWRDEAHQGRPSLCETSVLGRLGLLNIAHKVLYSDEISLKYETHCLFNELNQGKIHEARVSKTTIKHASKANNLDFLLFDVERKQFEA